MEEIVASNLRGEVTLEEKNHFEEIISKGITLYGLDEEGDEVVI